MGKRTHLLGAPELVEIKENLIFNIEHVEYDRRENFATH